MPSISDILDSVSVPSLIKDNLIRQGQFERTPRGLRYYAGGFTVVFPVEVNGEKWAFRCWHSELGNVRKRFQVVSQWINNLRSPYLCNFIYCDDGIVVDGRTYPTTRMRWVEGVQINKYIESHVQDSASLKSLAASFLEMIEFLHQNRIAHGDLQHGNIIVDDGEIKLVDYDSLFVPGMDGNSDIIIGKADFQHPKRKDAHIASEKLDYFSELVIYLSIYALSLNPGLIKKFSIDDSLLFRASDWADFTNSKIYNELNTIDDDDIKLLLGILVDYLKEDDINNLRPFDQIWRDLIKEPVIHSLLCGNQDGVVYKETDAEVSWDIENASKVFLNGEEMATGKTSKVTKFSADCDIELLIINGLHRVTQSKRIKVVEKPEITISANNTKLRMEKGKVETTYLKWDVQNFESVSVRCGNKIISTKPRMSCFPISPQQDTTFIIDVIGRDKKTSFSKSIEISVREPANIILSSDKAFTLPGVPITISWNVKNAKAVSLNNNIVPLKGKAIFKPTGDTEYILSVEDEFEIKTEKLFVRMLPLPVINSVLVTTPHINNNVGIQYNAPQFTNIPEIPIIETRFVEINVPYVGDLKESGLFVELPKSPKKKLSEKFSQSINRIFKKNTTNI